ncbi:hypothetical protein GGR58DRAFT_302026 [Xylaria digitata]|nr:hypothetical protein GGR58DRAFT_302026 [Xylaria digitata]
MDTVKNDEKQIGTQRSSQRRRSSSTNKRIEEKEGVDRVVQLEAGGWTRAKSLSANKVFLSGLLIVEGRLHATDKLCLCGDFHVTDKLECEGNFTLRGTVECRNKPAVVNNMIIIERGHIYGDVVVKSGAYIKGHCIITGKLTVDGNLRINGMLRCGSLTMAGTPQVMGRGSRLHVEGEKIVNGVDLAFARLAHALQLYETNSRGEQDAGYLKYEMGGRTL